MSQDIRDRLVEGGLVLQHAGLDDSTRGHLSVRDPGDPDRFFMKPHSFGLDEITHDNIVTCTLDGEKVAGGGRRHSEVYIHSEIFRARPEINAVLHIHPCNAIALAATGRPLRYYCVPATEFAHGLGMFDATRDLIRTPELGAQVAAALGPRRAALMQNHGIVVAGRSIEECVFLAISLEDACEMQLKVESVVPHGVEIPRQEIDELYQKLNQPVQYEINFQYLLRVARRASGR